MRFPAFVFDRTFFIDKLLCDKFFLVVFRGAASNVKKERVE